MCCEVVWGISMDADKAAISWPLTCTLQSLKRLAQLRHYRAMEDITS